MPAAGEESLLASSQVQLVHRARGGQAHVGEAALSLWPKRWHRHVLGSAGSPVGGAQGLRVVLENMEVQAILGRLNMILEGMPNLGKKGSPPSARL